MSKKVFKSIIGDVFPKEDGTYELLETKCKDINFDRIDFDWLNQIKEIKLYLNNKKYFKNIRRKLMSPGLGVNNNSNRNWTKYQKVQVEFNGSKCKHKGRYRLTGDLLDHANFDLFGELKGFPHSIKIKLKNASINNIRKFKLFVPKSRDGKYEILNVLINKELGFIAPRTALINVIIGGKSFKAIFQEDISKELLEFNNFHESIIIEGDEGFYPFTIPKIINTNKILGQNQNMISRVKL